MRKDLRVGLGIGGVLLAVLVVALVVKSHTRQKTEPKAVALDNTNKPDTDTTPAPPDPAVATSTDPVSPPAALPAPAAPSVPAVQAITPEKPDPFDPPVKSSWDQILLNGAMPTPAPTMTPSAGTSHAIGDHFSPSSSGPGLTPGTFPPHPMLAGETPRATPAGARGSRTHVIAEGETFSTIAKSAYGSSKYYLLIEKANPNVVPERLRPGTKINLPELTASEHAARHTARGSAGSAAAVDSSTQCVVKPNDSLYRISMRLYGSANKVDALYEFNKDRIGPDRGRLKLGMVLKLPLPPTSASR